MALRPMVVVAGGRHDTCRVRCRSTISPFDLTDADHSRCSPAPRLPPRICVRATSQASAAVRDAGYGDCRAKLVMSRLGPNSSTACGPGSHGAMGIHLIRAECTVPGYKCWSIPACASPLKPAPEPHRPACRQVTLRQPSTFGWRLRCRSPKRGRCNGCAPTCNSTPTSSTPLTVTATRSIFASARVPRSGRELAYAALAPPWPRPRRLRHSVRRRDVRR